jgi:hypothetical protein
VDANVIHIQVPRIDNTETFLSKSFYLSFSSSYTLQEIAFLESWKKHKKTKVTARMKNSDIGSVWFGTRHDGACQNPQDAGDWGQL